MEIKILSLNISEIKGVAKTSVALAQLNNEGVVGDAHAGLWHRQVSLLGTESVDRFSIQLGRKIGFGEFGENITTQGYELSTLQPMDRIIGKEVVLEVTQIGKKCHGGSCTIFQEVGSCVMPKEGIFAKVIKQGNIKVGDALQIERKMYRCTILTLSDRASKGEYQDKSGPLAQEMIAKFMKNSNLPVEFDYCVIPDDPDLLLLKLQGAIAKKNDLIITTGGTGLGPRDISPETMKMVIQKEIPGIMELIRVKYGMLKPNAILSRGIAGVSGQSLMFAIPGYPKAVKEYLDEILKIVKHLFEMLHGQDGHE